MANKKNLKTLLAISVFLLAVVFGGAEQTEASLITHSVADFSGTQGQKNWYYGYYVSPYTSATFQEMDQFDGWSWYDSVLDPLLWDAGGIPGFNEWVVRRWVSDVSGEVTITGKLAKWPYGDCGDGIAGHIIVDGVEVWTQYIEWNDTVGVDYSITVDVNSGSIIDFAIDPNGTTNWCDETTFTAVVVLGPPLVPVEDNYIDWKDLDALANEWLNDCNQANSWCNGADIDRKDGVDFADFAMLAEHWRTAPEPNLIIRYEFDETSGNIAYDYSGNGHHGYVAWWDGDWHWGPQWEDDARRGRCLKLNGIGIEANDVEWVYINPYSLPEFHNRTIAVWVKNNGLQPNTFWGGTAYRTMIFCTSFDYRMELAIDARGATAGEDQNGPLRGRFLGAKYKLHTEKMLKVGEWNHVALVIRDTETPGVDYPTVRAEVYLNGVLEKSATSDENDENEFWRHYGEALRGANIGGDGGWTRFVNASLDDFRIYDYALSADEMAELARVEVGTAWGPSPVDEAIEVPLDANLSWLPGEGTASHDVYFGTDFNDVNDANDSWPVATGPNDPNVYKGNQTETTYDPCGLELDTTYFWRIDEVDGTTIQKGNVWSFTTIFGPPHQASNPYPPNGASNVNIYTDLGWTIGSHADSHDVYFGTDFNDVNDANDSWPVATEPNDPNVYKGNQPGTMYEPNTMQPNTTYHWRIDEKNVHGMTGGEVWSFTTGPAELKPAFPDAEGAGKWTVGGRGGTVYEVTNLDDSGTGSLRAAIEASGPRIVVFNVSGTITLESRMEITNPYITIAGQTAPGDGVCLRDYELRVSASQVIVRYLRFRPGDEIIPLDDPSCTDSLSIAGGSDIMIDHCSASWSVDETLSASLQPPYETQLGNVTVQWCMITESLNDSVHVKGPHGCGSLVKGSWDNKYSFHHNLFAHHEKRNPQLGNYHRYNVDPDGCTLDFRNNVFYDWGGGSAGSYDSSDSGIVKLNFIGNYYLQGPNSDGGSAFSQSSPYSGNYFADNWMDGSCPVDPWSLVIFGGNLTEEQIEAIKRSEAFDVTPVATDSADVAYTSVLAGAGAVLPASDAVDVRVINEVIDGTGSIIDDEDEVGGWPVLYSLTAPSDNDSDGMANYWENQYGLDPNDDGDSAEDLDGDGYTNIEEYLNNADPNGNNDTIVYIAASISRAYEQGQTAGQFTVYRTGDTGSALTVNYTVNGDATSGADYTALSGSVTITGGDSSATIAVIPVNDPDVEDPEQVIVSIDASVDYKLGLPRKALVVIEDND